MKKRGFEIVSFNQWLKDAWEMDTIQYDNLLDTSFKYRIIFSYAEIEVPKRATSHSAGYDVFSTKEINLFPGEDTTMPLGWKVYMLEDEKLSFYPRSGLGFKYYLRLANTTGIIDSDYYNNNGNEGHCWLKIRNEGDKEIEIKKGMAIVQCVFEKYLITDDDNFNGNIRLGGLGSTS